MKHSQLGFLFRHQSELRPYAQRYLEAVDRDSFLSIPGSTKTSSVEKELCEAHAVWSALCSLSGAVSGAVVIDVCAGKGWLALLFAARGAARVVAVDRCFSRLREGHVAAMEKLGVRVAALDLLHRNGEEVLRVMARAHRRGVEVEHESMGDNFSDSSRAAQTAFEQRMALLSERVDAETRRREQEKEREEKKQLWMCAVHPCGELAFVTARNFVRESEKGDVCVIVPCCSPPSPDIRSYAQVCQAVAEQFSPQIFEVETRVDPHMVTDKNCLIVARRK